jgi:hypothetical protein
MAVGSRLTWRNDPPTLRIKRQDLHSGSRVAPMAKAWRHAERARARRPQQARAN